MVQCPEGHSVKQFNFATALSKADVLVSIAKLKSHQLMAYTGAMKNLFGLVVGLEKAQTHYRFPNKQDFASYLTDLNIAAKPQYAIMDAIVGMEGPGGPGSGDPIKLGFLAASDNILALDWKCASLVGYNPHSIANLEDSLKRINISPIGACALAGSGLPLDRKYEADLMGFSGVTQNSLDSVSDRDYCLEVASDLSIVQMHLSRFCEEVVLWATTEFSFIELSERWSTGSSIMPQKKNPDFAELIRGRTGKVYGDLFALLTMMKALPLAYDRDMQEDKDSLFDACDTVLSCVRIFTQMISTASWNKSSMKDACKGGYLNATDIADYLVRKGMPFRTAHGVSARAVRIAIEKNCELEQLSLEELKNCSSLIEDDIYSVISAEACVEARKTIGGPASEMVKQQISELKEFVKTIK